MYIKCYMSYSGEEEKIICETINKYNEQGT